MADLLSKGLSEQEKISQDPKSEGMDNMPDSKNQKPMPTPKTTMKDQRGSFPVK